MSGLGAAVCFPALILFFGAPVKAQMQMGLPDISPHLDPNPHDPSYRTIFSTFKAAGGAWTVTLRVPRSGHGVCYFTGIVPVMSIEMTSHAPVPADSLAPIHRYDDNRLVIGGPAEIYQGAPIVLGNLSQQNGAAIPDCKFLTGAPKGIIVINRQGIFAILWSDLSFKSFQHVVACLGSDN